ncbi:hypothetical protein JAAARDRAFT_58887 [Jaapia argillacea MUCL 33604]|uniref:G-protein coupled receptors family 1 profile domain-containing protein n=1 Tax=Jaapia argillacea MUCL 33604 TaxID=933084 RepID=A0A067PPA5_9AGAM|nr:hypothetical protein JAAARDRAFT_58887 [Jaapia argillacea MUCL 33604]
MPEPRLDGTEIVLVVVESVLWGAFMILFCGAVNVLIERRRVRKEVSTPLLLTAILLFCSITTHWIIDISRAFDAFVYAQDHTLSFYNSSDASPNAAVSYLSEISNIKNVVNSGVYVFTTLVGDAFMIYRLFIVWGRNLWVVLLPLLLWVALLVTGSATTWIFAFASSTNLFNSAGAWITASFVITLLENLVSTGLIAYRIWITSRAWGDGATYSGSKIIQIIIESAALYSCCLIISLCAYLAKSNVQFVAVAVNSPVVGIIFALILTRAHSNSTSAHSRDSDHHVTTKSMRLRSFRASRHPTSPMAIQITTAREIDADDPAGYSMGTPSDPGLPFSDSITPSSDQKFGEP